MENEENERQIRNGTLREMNASLTHKIRLIFMWNPNGLTLDDIQTHTGAAKYKITAIRNRMTNDGYLHKSETKRMNNDMTSIQLVWYTTEQMFLEFGDLE